MLKLLLILLLSSAYVFTAASSPTFGLKDTSRRDPMKLVKLKMESIVEGSYQELQYYLTYKNTKDHAVETTFYFPRDQDFIFHKFEATFHHDRTVTTKIVDKEQNHTEPESSSEFISLAVGKLQANKTVKILFSIIKPLKLHLNKFYELKFPAITNQGSPFIFDQDLKEWDIDIRIRTNTEVSILANPTHSFKLEKISWWSPRDFGAYGRITVPTDKDFIVYFASKTDYYSHLTHHSQYISYNYLSLFEMIPAIHPDNPNDRGFFLNIVPDLNYFSDAYVQRALRSLNHDGLLELQKDAFALEQRRRSEYQYFFLIDSSDSLKGARFETLKKTLIALLQTLPPQSTIHLYSTSYDGYMVKDSFEYRCPNAKEAIEWIQTLEADMSEKRLLKEMKQALNHWEKVSLIVLTDGETLNSKRILNFMSEKSASGFRICSLVTGKKMSKKTLQEIGNAGNCWSEFVAENEDIGDRAIHLMRESARKPNLYWNIEIQCKDFQEKVIFKKDVARSVSLPYDQAFKQWIELEESPDLNYCELNLEYFEVGGSISEKKTGRICHKNLASKCITFFEDAKTTDRYHKIENHRKIRLFESPNARESMKQWIISRSKQYQILSNFTSLVPVVQKNTQGQSNQNKKRDIDL